MAGGFTRTSIDKLLKKKRVTGREIGLMALQGLASDTQKGKQESLYTLDELRTAIDNLSNAEYNEYTTYSRLYSLAVDIYNIQQANIQQFYHAYNRLLLTLNSIGATEMNYKQADKNPLILTENQYNFLKDYIREQNHGYVLTNSQVIIELAEYFVEHPTKAPAPVKAILKGLKQEPATNTEAIAEIETNYLGERGYFKLKDGRRSDKDFACIEEFKEELLQEFKAAEPALYSKYNRTKEELEELFESLSDPDIDLYLDSVYGKPMLEAQRELWNAESPEQEQEARQKLETIENAQETNNNELNKGFRAYMLSCYHPHKKTITKHDILLYGGADYYIGLKDNGAITPARFMEFVADYPALFEAIRDYLTDKLKGDIDGKPYKEIPVEEIPETYTGVHALLENKIGDYSYFDNITENDIATYFLDKGTPESWHKAQRAKNGIAILQGEQKNPLFTGFNPLLSGLFDLNEIEDQQKEYIYSVLNVLLKEALERLFAYDKLLELAIEHIEPALKSEFYPALAVGFKEELDKVNTLNDLMLSTYAELYGEEAEVEKKQAIFKEIFSPVEIESLRPTQEAIDKVQTAFEMAGRGQEFRQVVLNHPKIVNALKPTQD